MEPSSKSQGRWPWQAIALGVGGGVSSAGLVYSATRGGVGLSTLLFVLAPLPSQIAGFGWGLGAAIVAGVAGTLVMAMIASVKVALVYVVVLALPVALITHLVLLARYDAQGTLVDWFPAGRILAAIVVMERCFPPYWLNLATVHTASWNPTSNVFSNRWWSRLRLVR